MSHQAAPPLPRPGCTLVFVFGTLKQGFPNFHVNKGRRVGGTFRTLERRPLLIVGVRYPLNYGFNRLRFVAPVPVNSRVRGHFVLKSAEAIDAAQRQIIYDVTVEIEGAAKPALVAEWLSRLTV